MNWSIKFHEIDDHFKSDIQTAFMLVDFNQNTTPLFSLLNAVHFRVNFMAIFPVHIFESVKKN